ncbi:MAG: glycosyltransferase family 4 protein [Thermoguttaceae bacterium]
MRIGLVVEHFQPHRGGLEQWAWQFTQAMIARGHEMHVLAQSFCDAAIGPALLCHRLPGNLSRNRYAAAAADCLAGLQLDVVHDTGAGWRCDVYQPHFGSRASLIRRSVDLLPGPLRPFKRMAHRCLPRYRQFAALEARQFVDDGRLFVALSRKVADAFVADHGVRPESIRIVPNGVDCDLYAPENRALHRSRVREELRLPPDTLLLLMVAHNFRLKGLAQAIRALAQVAPERPGVHLAVVGGGSPHRYRLLARWLRVEQRVTFLGPRPGSVPYLAAADVLIHPTYYDACSLVVLEALASGLPVISTRATGVDELMTDGVEGFLVADPAETSKMAASVRSLMDPSLRDQMGRAARKLALQHPFSRCCGAIEAVYLEIVSGRRRTGRAA